MCNIIIYINVFNVMMDVKLISLEFDEVLGK